MKRAIKTLAIIIAALKGDLAARERLVVALTHISPLAGN